METIIVKNNRQNGWRVSEEDGKMMKVGIKEGIRYCTFDRNGTRFQINVQTLDNEEYLVSIHNFYFSMTTPRPHDIGYKLMERGVMVDVDAESVELAISHLMKINN